MPEAFPKIFIFCCSLRIPRNAGMICRIADGFGVKKIFFEGSQALQNPLVIKKTSRSASQFVEHEIVSRLDDFLEDFKKSGGAVDRAGKHT
ncbi:MAG: hypothetical protein N3F09_08710 [Bacteroidia bacterium]|nr:hypothetical protein [Bacteroidia bacterium]